MAFEKHTFRWGAGLLVVAGGVWLLFVLVFAGRWGDHAPIPPDGAALMEKYDCSFCHAMDRTTPPEYVNDISRNCVHCHQQEGIVRFVAPSLALTGRKFQRGWLQDFLKNPVPVRPHLQEEMPDFGFTDAEITALVERLMQNGTEDWKSPLQTVSRLQDEVAHTERLQRADAFLKQYKCTYCHVFTGYPAQGDFSDVDRSDRSTDVRYFAPDLRFSRERLQPEWIPGYLLDPYDANAVSAMPANPMMTQEEAEDLAYLLLYAKLEPVTNTEQAFTSKTNVSYLRDVKPILETYCTNICHYPNESEQMGWATGYAGGFGFPRREFDMSSYEGLMRGSKDERGRFRRMITPGYKDSPFMQRLRGEIKPAMPMGVKMPEKDKQILEQWILEGAKNN